MDAATIIFFFTFRWLKNIFKLGNKGIIPLEEIYKPKSNLESKQITDSFIELWEEELTKKNPTVLRIIFKNYGCQYLFRGWSYSILEIGMK